MSFSNFLLWAVYPSVVILAGKKTIFNNSKLVELGTIHFYNLTSIAYTLTIKATHQQITTCPNYTNHTKNSDHTKNVKHKFSFLFNMKLLLKANFFSHVACLVKTSNSRYKYSGPFLRSKILWYVQNSQWV